MEESIKIPEHLLHAVSELEGGRVSLIVGAGCSAESPTDLPLSRELSLDAHRKLVEDGVLNDGECSNPSDLSCLAETVWKKTGSQQSLVGRFPCDRLRTASPNEGHLLAAALLYEQALCCIITLNFDLALSIALGQIGTKGNVIVISKPEDHGRLGLANLVYLHRNVDADPDQWVLRSSVSDENWARGWERVVTEKMVSAPVTVFVGLGSPVGVIEHSTLLILKNLGNLVKVYQVDPLNKDDSALFKKLGLPEDSYLQMTWVQFMRQISHRLVEEHRAELEQACNELIKQEGWNDTEAKDLCLRLTGLGLIAMGRIRARWMLASDTYLPRRKIDPKCIAYLLLTVGIIENKGNIQTIFRPNGIVEFWRGNSIIGAILLAHGLGVVRWAAMEAKLKQSPQFSDYNYGRSAVAVVTGVNGGKPTSIAPPANIVCQENPTSLIPSNNSVKIFTVDEIREQPDLVAEILS